MPTFNKDKDSLDSDRNGTYQGTDSSDKVYYDNYIEYTTEESGLSHEGNIDETTSIDGEVYQVKANAKYDDDTNTVDDDVVVEKEETHTAKKTASAEVVLMSDWLEAGGNAGNFWVYDEDGWAYWANPIMPGEATGLLLDGIRMKQNPGEKCYYGINVVAQFATVGDWEYFENKDGSLGLSEDSDAMRVMAAASSNVPVVTVTNLDNQTTVDMEGTDKEVNFSASVSVGPAAGAAEGDFVWKVYNADLDEATTSTIADNGDGTVTLTVGEDETNKSLIVAASSTQYPGAVGLSSIAVKQPDEVRDDNIKITDGIMRTALGIPQADIILYDADGEIVDPQPTFDVKVEQNGVATTAAYKVHTYKNEAGITVTNVTIEAINKGDFTITASYKDANGVTHFETASVSSAASGVGTATDTMKYAKSQTINTDYVDISYHSVDSKTPYFDTGGSGGSGVRMNGYEFFAIGINKGGALEGRLQYPLPVTFTVVEDYDNGVATPVVSPDDYFVIPMEGETEGEWSGLYIILIPYEEGGVPDYDVYASLVGNGYQYDDTSFKLEEGVTYGTLIDEIGVTLKEGDSAFQDITITGLDESSYPLTVKVYAFETEESNYVDENLTTTYTITKEGGSLEFTTEMGNREFSGALNGGITDNTSSITLHQNMAPNIDIYMGVTVQDSLGNFCVSQQLLAEGAYVGCFTAGTKVLTADGFADIEDIKLGDKVYSINMETGKKELASVTWIQEDIFVTETYTIQTEDESIVTTAEHPFYVEGREWVKVKNLAEGDKLRSLNGGTATIENIKIEKLDEPVQVYNFTVEGNHNYLITESELLVHNKPIED